jgi:hypothetical protein
VLFQRDLALHRCFPRLASGLEPLFSKSASGWGFQIFFEYESLFIIVEGNVCLHLPWSKFRCVRNLAGIVLCQSCTQVIGYPDVKMGRIDALEDVDVFHSPPSFLRNFGAAAFARFAMKGDTGLPSRSSRSERRLVEPGGIEPPTS